MLQTVGSMRSLLVRERAVACASASVSGRAGMRAFTPSYTHPSAAEGVCTNAHASVRLSAGRLSLSLSNRALVKL
eukprot:3029124-Pleurochrysis_carterae.AAC.2